MLRPRLFAVPRDLGFRVARVHGATEQRALGVGMAIRGESAPGRDATRPAVAAADAASEWIVVSCRARAVDKLQLSSDTCNTVRAAERVRLLHGRDATRRSDVCSVHLCSASGAGGCRGMADARTAGATVGWRDGDAAWCRFGRGRAADVCRLYTSTPPGVVLLNEKR